jgi:hypothetical protein
MVALVMACAMLLSLLWGIIGGALAKKKKKYAPRTFILCLTSAHLGIGATLLSADDRSRLVHLLHT